jgi:hypothetical protein
LFILIGILISSQYFISDSFAQNSEESIGTTLFNATTIMFVSFVILLIPAIIIVVILWAKKKLTGRQLKFIFLGMVVFIPVLLVVAGISLEFQSDEEKAEREAEIEIERQIQLEKENQQRLADQQAILERKGDKAFADAKRELDDYLISLKKSVQECNNIPDSMKISSLVQNEAEEIVLNSALMYLAIEEIEKAGYTGLSSYKQRIANTVDELTDCLNRH